MNSKITIIRKNHDLERCLEDLNTGSGSSSPEGQPKKVVGKNENFTIGTEVPAKKVKINDNFKVTNDKEGENVSKEKELADFLSPSFCTGAWTEFRFNYWEQIEETIVRSSKKKGEMGDTELPLKVVGDLRRKSVDS